MVVGACRHRGESAGVVVVESGAAGCEGVEDGCVNDVVSVSSDLISSEGVGGDPDDVHIWLRVGGFDARRGYRVRAASTLYTSGDDDAS